MQPKEQKSISSLHVQSKIFISPSKTLPKFPTFHPQFIIPKTLKKTLKQVIEIGNEKYKTAMKHMEKFNNYQYEMKCRKENENLTIDHQCTFRPKTNKKKKYMNVQPKLLQLNYTQKNKKSQEIKNEQKSQEKKIVIKNKKEIEQNLMDQDDHKRRKNLTYWYRNNENIFLNRIIKNSIQKKESLNIEKDHKNEQKNQCKQVSQKIHQDNQKQMKQTESDQQQFLQQQQDGQNGYILINQTLQAKGNYRRKYFSDRKGSIIKEDENNEIFILDYDRILGSTKKHKFNQTQKISRPPYFENCE